MMFRIRELCRPLSPGAHFIQMSLFLGMDHWDGFGTDPAFNLLPTGETLFNEFTVRAVPVPSSLYLLTLGAVLMTLRRRSAARGQSGGNHPRSGGVASRAQPWDASGAFAQRT